MGCILNAGITKDCAHRFGGIKEVWLGNFSDLEVLSYNEAGQITGATVTTGSTIYEFEFEKNTGQALQELQREGSSSFIMQTLNFQLNNITQEKKKVLLDMSLAEMFAIIKFADNVYRFFGEPEFSAGLEAEELVIDTGTAQSDESGATISLMGASTDYANVIEASVVEGLVTE